jgi:uncharacterized membrane protein YhaH (DUF805 family)
MELLYDVLKNITNPNRRLGRKDYFLTVILYSIIVNMFVGIISTVVRTIDNNFDFSVWYSVLVTLLGLPLYSAHYHRLRDTGLKATPSASVVGTGFILKVIHIGLSFANILHPPGAFGTGTLLAMFGSYYYMPNESLGTILFVAAQGLYLLINLILILTKSNQFSRD